MGISEQLQGFKNKKIRFLDADNRIQEKTVKKIYVDSLDPIVYKVYFWDNSPSQLFSSLDDLKTVFYKNDSNSIVLHVHPDTGLHFGEEIKYFSKSEEDKNNPNNKYIDAWLSEELGDMPSFWLTEDLAEEIIERLQKFLKDIE